LIERLRQRAACCAGFEDGVAFLEAADMIGSLQAQIERMEKEIKPWVGAAHTARTELITAKLKIEDLEKKLLAREAELWLEKHRVHTDDERRTEPTQA